MAVFPSSNAHGLVWFCSKWTATLVLLFSASLAWAQPGGLGCLVDAGISPQEVCVDDHIFLGGNPTVPEALSGEVASIMWSVVTPGVEVEFSPSAFEANPQVYIDQVTTFEVTMTLNDGSTCSSQVTLMPIEQPTLDLPTSIVQCDGVLQVQFVNATPSNSVFIDYQVNWGDGTVETLDWAEGFSHAYDQAGSYSVGVIADLGLCSNSASVEVFVGSAPSSPNLVIDPTVCSSSSLELVWQGLSDYPLGTAWLLEVEGAPAFSGQVQPNTSDTLTWQFGSVTDCVDALSSVSFYAEALNTCSSPTEPSVGSAEVQVQLEPTAEVSLVGDSCAQVTLQVGEDTFCPDLLEHQWSVTQNGQPAALSTLNGGPTEPYWVFLADSGHYEVVLQSVNDACGSASDTSAFCVEMPTPTSWDSGDLVDGAALQRCIGDSIFLGIDSLIPVCTDSIAVSWSILPLDASSDTDVVGMTTDSQFGRWFTFDSLGHFLIELGGAAGCGDFTLSASVLVTEVPELQLSSYDSGQEADSVLCVGETVTVTASLDAYQLSNGAYGLEWTLLDTAGVPSNAADIVQFGDSSVIVQALTAGVVNVALQVSGTCGVAHDTLSLTIEGPYPNNYTVLSGVELDLPTPYPVFMQCLEDTLVLQYNAPWAEEVNISALALDVVDVVDIDPPHVGNLMWLSTGENLAFEIQYVSNAGCVYEDTLSFRSLFLPEIHVFTPDVVCGGEDAQFDAEVIPGSTGIMAAYDWIQVNGPNTDSDLGVVVQTTEDPVFFAPPPCNVGLHMHAQVTDNYGCVGVTPNPASGYASCPAPPQALGNGTSGSVATCTAQDSLATLALLGIPEGGVWTAPEGVVLNNDTATATASQGNAYINLQYTIVSDLGCPSSSGLCWIQASQDSTGTCDIPEICDDPTACNYNFPPECGITGCIYLPDLPDANIVEDSLTFCQSSASHALSALEPTMGTWSGQGVSNTDGMWGSGAWLSLSTPGEWYVYFEGGIGGCSSLDSVHVTIHPAPTHDHLDYVAACGGSTLDFDFSASGTGGVCWSFQWYDQTPLACSDSTTWEVDGSGFVAWEVVDSLGCSSSMVFELEDWGGPQAIAGGDTTLCLGATPNVMEFEFGEPYALGCNPTSGEWSGQGASYEFFAEVWNDGNCVQPEEPWTDSVWVFNASELGEFEWIWTVVDCHGCIDQDTITVTVEEPTPPFIPSLDFCLEDPVGLVSPQIGACWTGPGIDPNYVFDPYVAGVGEHTWTVGFGEGSCAMHDTVVAVVNPNPEPSLLSLGENPCIGTPFNVCLDESDPVVSSWTVQWSSYPDMQGTEGCEGPCCTMLNAQSGSVTALVTDTKGCTGEAEQVISLATTIPVTLPDTLEFCADGGEHLLLGALPAFGVWSGDMVLEDSLFITEEQGLFDLVYSYVSPDGCLSEGFATAQVVAVPEPEIATPPTETCWLSPLLLQSADDGVWIGEGINADGSIQVAAPGTYTYQLAVGEGSCYAFDEVDVTFLPLPSSNILTQFDGASTPLCTDEPLAIDISEEYIAENGIVNGFALGCEGLQGTFPHFTFQPNEDCAISVVVQDENGCSASETHTIVVPGPQPFYPGPGVPICLGQTAELDGYIVPGCNADDLEWLGECVTPDGQIVASEVGICVVELHVDDCNGCPLVGEREILVLDVPSVNIAWEDSVVCDGEEVDMAVDVYGGSLSYEWTWVDGSLLSAPDTPWVAVNEGLAPIDVQVSVSAENLCGVNDDSATLTINPTIEINPSSSATGTPLLDSMACAPVWMTFVAEAPGASEWVWSDWMEQDADMPNAATFVVDAVDTVTVFDLSVQAGITASMCSNPTAWTLTVVPEPQAQLSADLTDFCGDAFEPGLEYTAEQGAPEWAWTGGGLPSGFPDEWTITESGATVLTLVVTTEVPGASCVSTATLPLSLYPQPVADFALLSDSVVCAPGTFEILDLSADAVEIAWYVDYVGGWLDPGETLNLLLPIAGQYGMAWAALGEGGCNDTLFVSDVFEVLPSPNADIWSNQPAFIPWSMEGTEFVFNDISLGGDSTIWTVGDSTIIDEDILNFFYEDPGVYSVSQQVYNEFGCQDTVSFRFEIIDELAIHVPTAFTPNGDDLNDVWKPVLAGESRIEAYHLQVLSRSGQVMFETFDPSAAWDALDVPRPERLEDVSNSVFMYVLRVLPESTPLEPNPEWFEYTGHVMIVD